MHCPFCSHPDTRVVDSRLTEPGDAVRRRRECEGCGKRFTTYERAAGVQLVVRKRDGRTEPWDRDKLLTGLLRAATKRPVSVQELEQAVDSIAMRIRSEGGEASSELIGELALRALIVLDRVAAIRFASVYRRFDDLAEFEQELRRLESEPVPAADQMALAAPPDPSGPEATMGSSPTGEARAGEGDQKRARRRHAAHP